MNASLVTRAFFISPVAGPTVTKRSRLYCVLAPPPYDLVRDPELKVSQMKRKNWLWAWHPSFALRSWRPPSSSTPLTSKLTKRSPELRILVCRFSPPFFFFFLDRRASRILGLFRSWSRSVYGWTESTYFADVFIETKLIKVLLIDACR